MKDIIANPELVAFCGLYCGACKRFLKGKCPGCHDNVKATWCGIRKCCIEHEYSSCADCADFVDPQDCRKFNNFISKIFGLIFRSDRRACIIQIKNLGLKGHADDMARNNRQSIMRK
ncbi:MAG TPA: DUF3795 domain-containing protein [Desulfomonilia bacterium]